jgi:hypothetical protein
MVKISPLLLHYYALIARSPRIIIVGIVLFVLVFLLGCADLRRYVAADRGFVSLRAKQEFGLGQEQNNYYVIEGNGTLSRGDTTHTVSTLLGRPDSISSSFEGYEIWTYELKKIKIYFDQGYLKHIREF